MNGRRPPSSSDRGDAVTASSRHSPSGSAWGSWSCPCTGAIYLGVLGMLAGGALADAVLLLVVYNLFFVLPLVRIVGAVAFGLSPSRSTSGGAIAAGWSIQSPGS